MRIAITTFATGSYIQRQKSLLQSIKQYAPHIDFYPYYDFKEIGSPEHKENPYAFKVYCIQKVRNMGYEIVIWLDAPIFLMKSIDDWIQEIQQVGVFLQEGGFKVGQWANDSSLRYFQISRDDAMRYGNIHAQIMGFDFTNTETHTFFAKWKECCNRGLFKGEWNNHKNTESQDLRCLGHRHDQTCAELVAYEQHIPLSKPALGRYFGAK
jgi:hypothetical protein